VAAILLDLTGMPTESIVNGGSPRTRARAVEKARTWLALSNGHPSCPP
jgi:hypothetical protein